MDAVILAAGKGTRMKSSHLKVLHSVGGKYLVKHAVDLSRQIKSNQIVVVVPDQNDSIQQALSDQELIYAVQKKQLGTGDALKSALSVLKKSTSEILVLNGDMPMISKDSLKRLANTHRKSKSAVSILTVHVQHENGFGRILRDEKGAVAGIVEARDATREQLKITETNVGVYLFDAAFVKKSILALRNGNAQKEYYITDLVALAVQKKLKVSGVVLQDSSEALGVNCQSDLNQLNHEYYSRQRQKFMGLGVTMIGHEIFIDANVKIAAGSTIMSPCYLRGQTSIASGVVIEPGCVLLDVKVGEGSLLKAYCYITDSSIAKCCQIGPFAHLRPKTKLADGVKIGNFVETKKSEIGEKSKVSHLSYIGDAILGRDVNVGAGTITCNYDGYNKFQTILEDGAFIGSDTQLVAPVRVGKGAFVGAGTTLTKNVDSDSLAVSRVQQTEIPGWAKKKRAKAS